MGAKIPVVINITPEYYYDKGHFWRKLNAAKALHRGNESDLLILVSYRYYKPHVTRKQVEHYSHVKVVFPHVVIIHAAGVQWNGHDDELRGMGIPIYEEGYDAGF